MTISDEDEQPISKTRLKQQMHELQEMGEKLVVLREGELAQVPMPDNLRDAVELARSLTKRGALHRQKQFIGKVMRSLDPAPIAAALERLEEQHRGVARRFHRVEKLRERLLEEGPEVVTELCEQYPGLDPQALRQHVRAAARERDSGRPVGARRALFRFLDKLLRQNN